MVEFSTKNEPVWFFFDETNPELGSIALRELSPDSAKKIRKITTKRQKAFKRGRLVETAETDEGESLELTLDYCIVDWKHVQIDGVAVECTKETKLQALRSVDFVKFITDCLEELTLQNKTIEEARAKNLSDTSPGEDESRPVTNALTSGTKKIVSRPASGAG